MKNILLVLAAILFVFVIATAINDRNERTPKSCAPGTTLVEYENGDIHKPICKGVPVQKV